MMEGALGELKPEVIITDKLCDFDENLFGVDELPDEEIQALAEQVAAKIAGQV